MKLSEIFNTLFNKNERSLSAADIQRRMDDAARANGKHDGGVDSFAIAPKTEPDFSKMGNAYRDPELDGFYQYAKAIESSNLHHNQFLPRVYEIEVRHGANNTHHATYQMEKLHHIDVLVNNPEAVLNLFYTCYGHEEARRVFQRVSHILSGALASFNFDGDDDDSVLQHKRKREISLGNIKMLLKKTLIFDIRDAIVKGKYNFFENDELNEAIKFIHSIMLKHHMLDEDSHLGNIMFRVNPYGIHLVLADPLTAKHDDELTFESLDHDLIMEVINSSSPTFEYTEAKGGNTYHFTDDAGESIEVLFEKHKAVRDSIMTDIFGDDGICVDLSFSRGGDYNLTGSGNSQSNVIRIFNTVCAIAQKYIGEKQPDILCFVASSNEKSRISLYRRIMRTRFNNIGNYSALCNLDVLPNLEQFVDENFHFIGSDEEAKECMSMVRRLFVESGVKSVAGTVNTKGIFIVTDMHNLSLNMKLALHEQGQK